MSFLKIKPEKILNLNKYPITKPYIHEALYTINEAQKQLKKDGLFVLNDFINPTLFNDVLDEAKLLAPLAYHNTLTGNAYLEEIDESLPEGHPKKITETTSLGAVAYDQIPKDYLIRKLYEWPLLTEFIQEIIGRKIYPYACPMGALNVAVMKEGDYLRWHFDQSEFVVSIPLQEAAQGGNYEYAPHLRSSNSPNFKEVKKILEGDRKKVKPLHAPPGSMVIFQGMNTLHRVTEIKSNELRLTLLLGYAFEPNVISSDYLKKIRYGRINEMEY